MKKIISIVLALCLILALVSCGKSGSSSLETNSGDSAESFVKPEQCLPLLLNNIIKETAIFVRRLPFPFAVRERIRTPDTLVRSQVLYPAELHAHTALRLDYYYIQITSCQALCTLR